MTGNLRVLPCLLLTLAATSATAASYYVSPSGSDAASGTIAAPLRTITRAAALARPGDVVEVRGGVYAEIVKIAAKGTASARIVFRSYPGEKAIIDGSNTAPDTNLVQLSNAEFVDFSRFEVRNSTRIGICGYGVRHVRISDNDVHHSVKSGIYVGYSTFGSTYEVDIERNSVHENVLENRLHTAASGWSQAISAHRSERVRISNNRVYQNDGEGIVFVLSDSGLARKNEVFDNYSVNIYLDNARLTTVDANFVYSTGNSRYYRNGEPADGIGTANETYATSNPSSDLTIINNIVLSSRHSFYYSGRESGGGLKNTTVANNTFHRASRAMLLIDAGAHSNVALRNNVFYQVGSTMTQVAAGPAFSHNNWYGGSAGAAAGSGDVLADPRLARAGGSLSDDYRLTSGSPLIGAGTTVAGVVHDHWLVARAGSFDIGAHQSGTSGQAFTDVAPGHPFFTVIETIHRNGVTAGCGNGNYCPSAPVTRSQMAAFLLRAKYGPTYVPPPATGTVFSDVTVATPAAAAIEQIAREGVTSGCGNNNYCPASNVTRAQMAVFLLRMKHGDGWQPPPARGLFGDVPATNNFAPWIEQLAAEGITAGCGGGNYCPASTVTRAQMAAFLVATFELT